MLRGQGWGLALSLNTTFFLGDKVLRVLRDVKQTIDPGRCNRGGSVHNEWRRGSSV